MRLLCINGSSITKTGVHVMQLKNIVSLVAASVLASAAFAGENMHTKMKMVVVEGAGDDGIHFELNSDELGFDLHEMQVGENQSIVDSQGRNILVTREEDGFSFNVDGKTIKLPALGGEHERVWVQKFGEDEDVDVEVIQDFTQEHDGGDVKIIKKKIEIRTEAPDA